MANPQDSVLWPLLHGMPFRATFDESWTAAYRKVNEAFADVVVPFVNDGDLIWVHDYHLLLLPRILRERLADKNNIRIGFFLHTAFPREDAFSILPLRAAVCDGLMSSDLVGFHTRDYVEIFLDSAENVLTYDTSTLDRRKR
jgi:trehalose 6-phosphate synthase